MQENMERKNRKAAPDQVLVARHDEDDHPAGEMETAPLPSDVMAEQFPVDLNAYSKKDREMEARLQLQDPAQPGVTPFGLLNAREEDFAWLEKKRGKAEIANLQRWFALHYDKASPAQKAIAHKLYPEFYEMREALLQRMIKLQARIARLKIHGPRNKRDVLFQYALHAGYIPADPLENIMHPERAEEQKKEQERKDRFVRGMLNPNARSKENADKRKYNATELTGLKTIAGEPYKAGTRNADGSVNGFLADYKALLGQFSTSATPTLATAAPKTE